MAKTLLHGNRRMGVVFVTLSVISGSMALATLLGHQGSGWWKLVLGTCCGGVSVLLSIGAWLTLRPRLTITEHELRVYLRAGSPFSVPLDVVEVFFIGQGPVQGSEPGQPHGYRGAVAANVIVRLAEQAPQWHQREVNLALGVWRDGYITIRGLWSENIDSAVLKRINRQLMQSKRGRRRPMTP